MKRLLALITVVAALAASSTAASAATGPIRLALSPGAVFPVRQLTLDLPPGTAPYDVTVQENGMPVIPHLTPITRNRVPVSLAVVLDSSDSMRGRALAAAEDAAQTLVDDKPARSEAALFGFAATPYLVHGWSSSAAAADAALGSIQPSAGTAIWDAVGMASQSLAARHGASRALVLLTDGVDTASAATLQDAAAAARSANARVFVVGLPGAQLDRARLEKLVALTGGTFVQVHSLSELHRVYASLAAELSQQYILRYTSQLRGTGRTVTVTVRAGGLQAVQRYSIPPTAPAAVAKRTGWWATQQALGAIAAGVGLLVLVTAYVLIRPKREDPGRKLAVYLRGGAPARSSDAVAAMPVRPRRSGPRPAPGRVWARFSADVERGDVRATPVQLLLAGMGLGTVVAAIVAYSARQPLAIVAGPLVGAIGTWAYVGNRASAWYRHFDATLPDSLAVLASSLRAGHSLLQAVDNVAQEADERTAREWNEVVRQTRLGIPVEDAIDEMTTRIGSTDLQWISLVARVQHQVGGNMAEMFDIVADTVRHRQRLRGQVNALTAQGRMTRWVLTIAPFALGAILTVMSPSYINGFLGSKIGLGLILAACCLIVLGSLWLKKIVEIEV